MVENANGVGSGDVGIELDISEVEGDLPVLYTEYNLENYHGLYGSSMMDHSNPLLVW